MPIHAPQNLGLLEVWTLKRHWSSSRPQKAHPWTEPHLHAIFGTDPSTGATCAQGEGIKKKKERRGKKLTVANWMFAHTTYVDIWSCVPGGLLDVVISFNFCRNRLNGYRDMRGRNSLFPITMAGGLYNSNSLYYRTNRDSAPYIDITN